MYSNGTLLLPLAVLLAADAAVQSVHTLKHGWNSNLTTDQLSLVTHRVIIYSFIIDFWLKIL